MEQFRPNNTKFVMGDRSAGVTRVTPSSAPPTRQNHSAIGLPQIAESGHIIGTDVGLLGLEFVMHFFRPILFTKQQNWPMYIPGCVSLVLKDKKEVR